MRDIWVISDTHFNHTNILKFKDYKGMYFRGHLFQTVEEMNERMVENWNAVVKEQDIVYHLGDVYMTNRANAVDLLSRLNGRKRLVLGNHDQLTEGVLHKFFQKITVWRMWPEFKLLFTHIPVHPDNLRGYRNVHGHIHQNNSPGLDEYVNVCVEKTDYTPVNIEELRFD